MTEKPAQASSAILLADLRNVPVFAHLEKADLEWFISQSEYHERASGETLIREGSIAENMFVLLEGELRGRREADGPDSPVISTPARTVTGLLPFSRLKVIPLTVRAFGQLRVLAFPGSKFPEMLQRMPELAQGLVGLMTDRVRTFTVVGQQRDKLAALGKLSAGLAHELNNPSAAARRSAAALRDCLARLREAGRSSSISPDDCAQLAKREDEIRSALKPADYKDEFERVEREESIQTWLESRKLKDAWKLAPLLTDANLTDAQLDLFAAAAGSALESELTRFATLLEMDRVAEELEHSTSRISDLIKAIKEYSYMDQALVQEVDVIKGLENTLTIMNHKLKRGIAVVREYAPELPKVMVNGSELNQVWTNLIDNAADAMKNDGTLRIRVARENEFVLVEIADTGPGIPPEVKSHIFDPFFTTKPVGQGTGLGLDFVYRIVTGMHGNVSVNSVPGDTRFEVRIPIHPPQ